VKKLIQYSGSGQGVEVAQTTVESLTQTVKVARSFFEVGMIPINDVLKAEVELAMRSSLS